MTRSVGKRLGAALLLILGLTLPAWPAAAAAPPWPEASYAYYAQDDSLRGVIEAFAQAFGIRGEITRAVGGTVTGRLFADSPGAFLDQLAKAYGIVWYYHDGTLHVSAAAESTRVPIELAEEDIPALRGALEGLGILDDRFGWGELPDRGLVIVSGPPAYVALVRRTVELLPRRRGPNMAITVFRLKHASVDDRTFFYRERQVVIPGIATILRNIVTNQANAASGTRIEPIGGLSVPIVAGEAAGRSRAQAEAKKDANEANRLDAPAQSPVIQADTRLNAVIVKDVAERTESYRRLIEMLDVPTALIEIEAAVIDVNVGRLAELGVRWQGRGHNVLGGFGRIVTGEPEGGEIALGIARDVSLQTILSGTGAFFLAKITALESTGDANVLSRPSVLTLDNLEAVLDLSETFYIKLEGERVADVVPVTAGVMLRVTPRLVEREGRRRISLAVDVEDGAIQSGALVSDLPTVRRSTISTQAVVGEDDSLLIGGYYFEEKVESREKVPVLGDIPLLGLLFSQSATEVQKRERLFMITPRVIEMPPWETPPPDGSGAQLQPATG